MKMVGRTPWSARVPPDPLFGKEISLIQPRKRPTGASAADQGVCPTINPDVRRRENYMTLSGFACLFFG
jgi:hypothetical protein